MIVSDVFTAYVSVGLLGALAPLLIGSRRGSKFPRIYYFGLVMLFAELILSGLLLFLEIFRQPIFLWDRRVVYDGFSAFSVLFISLISLFVYLAFYDLASESSSPESIVSIFYVILLSSSLVAVSGSITLFFVSWVTVSIASYVMVGIDKKRLSSDAAIKYALLGSVSTVFLVLWMASGVGLNGDLIAQGVNPVMGSVAAVAAGLFLMVAGGFKTGVFPFHWWLPDVYTEADGRVISLITGVVKIGVVSGLSRMIVLTVLGKDSEVLMLIIALLSIATMTYGNVAAMTTRVFSRIMAYSSIAHIGYILVGITGLLFYSKRGLVWGVQMASAAIMVHIIAYSLAKPIAFSLSSMFEKAPTISDLRGLWSSRPFLAFSLMASMLSLLGLPPFLGFWGKLYMFKASIGYSLPLVLIALINSGISSYYYGRIVRELFMPGSPRLSQRLSSHVDTVLFALAILLLVLGVGLVQRVYPIMWMYTP